MKTYLKRILLGVLLFGVITGFSAQYKSERRVVLPANEIHEGWFFAAGSEVVIDGTVNGDLYAAAGIVEINGTVKGDVLAAGGQVVINGAAARLVSEGDLVIVLTYTDVPEGEARSHTPTLVYVDQDNQIVRVAAEVTA